MAMDWQCGNLVRRVALAFALCCYLPVLAAKSITLGPYGTQEEFIKSATFLATNQIPYEMSHDNAVTESMGYIVVTRQISSSEARFTIRGLKNDGITDLLYISKGVYARRISGGVFNKERTAKDRIKRLANSRQRFTIMERTRTISTSTITVSSDDIPNALREKFRSVTGIRLPKRVERRKIIAQEPVLIVEPKPEPVPEPTPEPTPPPQIAPEPVLVETRPEPVPDAVPVRKPPVETVKPPVRIPEAATKPVTTARQAPRETDFPWTVFLIIAVTALTLAFLSYNYFVRGIPPTLSAIKKMLSRSGDRLDGLLPTDGTAREQVEAAKSALLDALDDSDEAQRSHADAETQLMEEKTARMKAESRAVKLNADRKKVQLDLSKRKTELETANERVQALSAQLKTSRANSTNQFGTSETIPFHEPDERLQELAEELEEMKKELQRKIDAHQDNDTKTTSRISELQYALERARAKNGGGDEESSGPVIEYVNEADAHLDEMHMALAAADARLAQELELLAGSQTDAVSRIESLTQEVEAAHTETKQESVLRLNAEQELGNANLELAATQNTLESQKLDSEQEASELQSKITILTQALNAGEGQPAAAAGIPIAETAPAPADVGMETQKRLNIMSDELQRNKQALEKAIGEAEQNALAEHAARLKLKQLTARELSHDQSNDQSPLHSSMPMSNPILRSMAGRFVTRLRQQLDTMETSFHEENYLDLVVITNWVKDESLTLGFEEFRPLISSLELCLRRQEFEPIEDIIKQLLTMCNRIEIPDIPVDDGSSLGVKAPKTSEPIPYILPENERKAELLENFVSQLGAKLLDMQSSWQEGDAEMLEKNCSWIRRYGRTLNVPEVIESVERLDSSVKQSDVDRISQKLWDLINIYSRIELVHGGVTDAVLSQSS